MSPWIPKPPRLVALLTALTAGLCACGQGPHIEGSVSDLIDMRYETAELLGTEEEISVRFITRQEAAENTILKVAARLDDLTFTPDQPIDLAAPLTEALDGPQRGTVSRSKLDEPARDFPRIARGSLTVEKALTPGAKVPGSFHVTFVNGTHVYSGRTLFGSFEATVP